MDSNQRINNQKVDFIKSEEIKTLNQK